MQRNQSNTACGVLISCLVHGSSQYTFSHWKACPWETSGCCLPFAKWLFAIAVRIMSLRQKNWGSGLLLGSCPMTLDKLFHSVRHNFHIQTHGCWQDYFSNSFSYLLYTVIVNICEPPILSLIEEFCFYSFTQQAFVRISVVAYACNDSPQETGGKTVSFRPAGLHSKLQSSLSYTLGHCLNIFWWAPAVCQAFFQIEMLL